MSKTIAVVSGKGGVGKTTTVANLSLALQDFGEKVVAMDCDQAASNLALQLDLHPEPENTLQDSLRDEEKTLDSISLHRTGLMVMPSSHAIEEETIEPDKLQGIVDRVDGTAIIDAPPGLTENVHNIIEVADEIIIVTNPEIPAVSDAVKVSEAVEERKGSRDNTWGVINKYDETTREVQESEVEMALEVPIVSKIPYDQHLKESIFEQTPVVRHSPFSKSAIEYKNLAAWMLDTEYRPPRSAPIKRFLSRFKRR